MRIIMGSKAEWEIFFQNIQKIISKIKKDLETAKNSGMPCISVLWGFRDKEFLAEHGAERYAKTAEDVLRFVEEM